MSQSPSPNHTPLNAADIHRDKLAMLGQLTAGVAHELNNPVGFVASNLNTLGRYVERITALVDELSQAAISAGVDASAICQHHRWPVIAEDLPLLTQETCEGAEHLKNLVADLKTLGRTNASPERTDPNDCIRSALNVLTHLLKHGFTVRRHLQDLPAIPLVRPQIIQAVTNIVHNAIQAMGEQGEILIESASSEQGVTIAIANDGPPIPPDMQDAVFDPHFSTKPTGAGSGLGLAIVCGIMEAHGGAITLDGASELGGPRFTLYLPIDDG